jgi:hypothetical protein
MRTYRVTLKTRASLGIALTIPTIATTIADRHRTAPPDLPRGNGSSPNEVVVCRFLRIAPSSELIAQHNSLSPRAEDKQ